MHDRARGQEEQRQERQGVSPMLRDQEETDDDGERGESPFQP
jgi:hypothetical protein